jgi:hypothetical protein
MNSTTTTDDILQGTFMQLHSLSTADLNQSIVEVRNKTVDKDNVTRYHCVLIPSESIDDLEVEKLMKVKPENLMVIPSTITNEEERVELNKKFKELESKYLFAADDPRNAAIRPNKNVAAEGYQEIAAIYHSYKHLSRVWQLKASMAIVFKTGTERENIYLQCTQRFVANLKYDISLTEENKADSILRLLVKFQETAMEFERIDVMVSPYQTVAKQYPNNNALVFLCGNTLLQNLKYFESGEVLYELYCKKEPILPSVGQAECSSELKNIDPEFSEGSMRKYLLQSLELVSNKLCERGSKLEKEGDDLSINKKTAEGKVKHTEACKCFHQAAIYDPRKLHPNECWYFAQMKKHPDIIIMQSTGQQVNMGQIQRSEEEGPYDEVCVYSFIPLRAAENTNHLTDIKFKSMFKFVVLGIPDGW